MERLKVNLFDREFIHTEKLLGYITCSDTLKPEKIEWVNGQMDFDGITVFTERYMRDSIVDRVKSRKKVLWLIEPRAVRDRSYLDVINYENKFDHILTYDTDLLKRSDKYVKYVVGQSRITKEEKSIYDKTKMVSMIASNKTLTVGHRFRHEISDKLSSKYGIDMWGSGYKGFNHKMDPLKDYRFSISVMNSKVDNFFTEILVDNFLLGTIPIFWGCPNIDEYFDINGVLIFDDVNELEDILKNLSEDLYIEKMESIKNNFELAQKYVSTDDYIADILKKL